MKKAIALLLALAMVFALAACGSKAEPAADTKDSKDNASSSAASAVSAAVAGKLEEKPEEKPADKPEEKPEAKGNGNVIISFPHDFLGIPLDEETVREMEEEDSVVSAKLNVDGTVTIEMTKDGQAQNLKDLKDSIEETVSMLTEGDEAVPSFTDISYNKNYSEFTIKVDNAFYNDWDSLDAYALCPTAAYYQLFSGTPVSDIAVVVRLVDGESGKELDSVTYEDYLYLLSIFSEIGSGTEDDKPVRTDIPEIEETVLYDKDGIKVTALEYVIDSIWDDSLMVSVENNTDSAITVSCEKLILNGYTSSGMMGIEVAPGKTEKGTLALYDDVLWDAGIVNIGEIMVSVYIYNPETYDEIDTGDVVTLRTSLYDVMDTEAQNIGEMLYSDKNVTIYGRYAGEDLIGHTVRFYIENDANFSAYVSVSECTVDGESVSVWFGSVLDPGTKAAGEMYLFSDDLEEIGVESPKEIACAFKLMDYDTFRTLFTTDPIVIPCEG